MTMHLAQFNVAPIVLTMFMGRDEGTMRPQ